MKKTLVNPETMVRPISNYSHGVRVETGDTVLIFVSGQIALDPQGNLVGPGDVVAQTEYIFNEIATILKAAGASLKDVLKANIYVLDLI